MLTTPTLINFLQQREGFRKHAYDDKHPNRTLTADTVIEGKLTIGYGTTRYPDGTFVKWNDTVSQQEGLDYLQYYIRTEIEPTLENLIHTPLKGCQYDALGSVLYQFGAEEVSDWRLIRRINKCEDWEKIALEWVDGTIMWMGEPRFWARRISELFMFFDLNWRAGSNVPVGSSVIEALEIMGVTGAPAVALPAPKPEPVLILDKPLPKETKPVARTITLPDEWDKMTAAQQTAWLNTGEFIALGGTVGEPIKPAPLPEAAKKPAAVTTIKKTIETPNIKPEAPPKAMETSQTFKGLSKSDSGKETAIIGTTVLGGVAYGLPYADKATAYIDKYPPQTIIMVIGGLAGMMALYGVWRWWRGQIIAYEGRQKAEGPKV
jgi:GH24 family phage-related lysozyme (muramidase)